MTKGKPVLDSFPHGIEIAGLPVRFACTVKISCMYIEIGSFDFAPNSNATSVHVGESKKSY